MYYAALILLVTTDILNQLSIRNVLYEFLMGNTSKRNFRTIKNAPRSFKDRITLSYIRTYIKSDVEKRSFNRYYTYNICSMIFLPVKYISAIIVIRMQILCFSFLYLLYMFSILIKMFVWSHERDPSTKFTPHAGRKYNRGYSKSKKSSRK